MDSVEIREILSKHCPVHFAGVFPADVLEITKLPSFMVLNTDESGETGKHWVCMYVNEQRCEFFDSQGQGPLAYHRYWHDALLQISPSYCYNTDVLQEPGSNVCGEYCIAYVLLRCHGFSFESILHMLKSINLKNFVSRLQ